jgi:hypothetical protein
MDDSHASHMDDSHARGRSCDARSPEPVNRSAEPVTRSADLALFADPRLLCAAFRAAPGSVPPTGSGTFRAAARRRHDCRRSRHECPRHKAKKLGLIGFVFARRRCKQYLYWVCFVTFFVRAGGARFWGLRSHSLSGRREAGRTGQEQGRCRMWASTAWRDGPANGGPAEGGYEQQ